MAEIIVGGALVLNAQNTPTRKGEWVATLKDIASIENPVEGMSVFVKSENASYRVVSLKEKTIAGVVVPGAMVDKYEKIPDAGQMAVLGQAIEDEITRATEEEKELLKRLQGTSAKGDPLRDPYSAKVIGGLIEIDEFFANDPRNGVFRFIYGTYLIDVKVLNNNLFLIRGYLKRESTWVVSQEYNTYVNVGSGWVLVSGAGLRNIVDNHTFDIERHEEQIAEYETELQNLESDINHLDERVTANEKNIAAHEDTLQDLSDDIQDEIARAIQSEINLKQEIADLIGESPETLDTIHEIASWILNDESGAAAMATQISKNATSIEQEKARAIDKENSIASDLENEIARAQDAEKEIVKDIEQGDIIAGLSREVYSLQGKEDNSRFLKRTTAGSTSIDSGVARLRQVGGGVLKNLVDGTFASGWEMPIADSGSFSVQNNVVTIKPASSEGKNRFRTKIGLDIENNIYYQRVFLRCSVAPSDKEVKMGVMNNNGIIKPNAAAYAEATTSWQFLSVRYKGDGTNIYGAVNVYDSRQSDWGEIYAKNYLYIDLTEMFGAGKEPTKEECDRMFAGVGALPKGISVAKPAAFKSVGYNQCDVSKAMPNKTVADGVITDGANYLVPMPCLPCKTGTGENNGYVIATGEGDTWSEDAITAVYYTPLNPAEVTGKLYLQELAPEPCAHCNGTHNVYVPACEGWLLIETASIDKLCAHFAWSGDRAVTDYEEYTDSSIEMPVIPEMSEWGLAGLQGYNDTIDFERNVYTRKVTKIVLNGTEEWTKRPNNMGFSNSKMLSSNPAISNKCVVYSAVPLKATNLTDTYGTIAVSSNAVYVCYSETVNAYSVEEWKAYLASNPITIYYAVQAPEEHPIKQRLAPAYIASDYGTEVFAGSEVPLNGNVLFYQRSLVSETRNFLDRLIARLGISDVTAVADKIADAITTTTTNEEEVIE